MASLLHGLLKIILLGEKRPPARLQAARVTVAGASALPSAPRTRQAASGSRHGPHENRLPPEHATRHPSFNTHPRDPPSPDVLCDFQREAIVWANVYSNIHVAPRGTLGCPCGVHVLQVNPPSTHPAGAVPGFGAGRTGPVGALFIVPFGLGTCSCSDQ